MVGRWFISLAITCLFNVGATADSISLQHNPSLATPRRALRATTKFITASHAVTGDLGRGFSAADGRSHLQVNGGEFFGGNVPRGILATSESGSLNLGFLGNGSPPQSLSTFDRLWRYLFHRIPTGARGRREQAGGGR